ncbi:unnamed protein product [marine sediment metagenome]|uniref:Uncharacterized protein n=1 Tax=marine sediment metagenome TaxID=412755 RepID=X1JYV3_9ZZZZ
MLKVLPTYGSRRGRAHRWRVQPVALAATFRAQQDETGKEVRSKTTVKVWYCSPGD